MASSHCRLRLAILLCGVASPAYAQQPASGPDIIVVGERDPGGARSEHLLTAGEIETYGVSTIGELIDELAAERGESFDDLVYMVNGRRVNTSGGIDGYPIEALQRIEILAAGSSLRAGGHASQRIVNLILKSQVRTYVGRSTLSAATDGEAKTRGADVSMTDIRGSRRVNLALSSRSQDALTEFDRDIDQGAGASPDRARARTLRPSVGKVELSLSAADQFSESLGGGLNIKLVRDRSQFGLGLGEGGLRLGQRIVRRGGETELQFNREVGGWLIAFVANYGEDRRVIRTDRHLAGLDGIGPTLTSSRTRNIGAEVNANGPLFELPAGPVNFRVRAKFDRDSIASESDAFTQSIGELAAGLRLPIASAAVDVLPWLGELSAGIELSRSRVSQLSTLANATYSVQWQPAPWIRLAGSITTGKTPPSIDLIASPLLATPGVRYFDPLTGETVDVVELSGGNPELGSQRGQDRRLSLNLKPLRSIPLLLTADYSAARNRDIISSLPAASELLLLAFPDRFVRDGSGVLAQVDSRPISLARRSEEQLRTGMNLNLPIGGRSRGGRLQLNLAHTILLSSTLSLRPGFASVDLLSREAIGLGASAARPRQEVNFSVGYAERGLGARLMGQRVGVSFLNLTDGGDDDVLRFAPLATFSLRGFVDGQRLLPGRDEMNGIRLSLSVLNLTNARQRVRDSRGATPLRYQPGYLDPIGRTVQLELRKAF